MILSDRFYYLQYYKENDLMVKICLPFIPCSGIVMSRNWITYMSRIFLQAYLKGLCILHTQSMLFNWGWTRCCKSAKAMIFHKHLLPIREYYTKAILLESSYRFKTWYSLMIDYFGLTFFTQKLYGCNISYQT